jgi:general secretion pathway protein K
MLSRRQFLQKRQTARRQGGFVLLLVLSALGLLAIVTASYVQIARTHVKVAAAASEGARAEALADAGVHIAILDLVAARESHLANRRFALDATPLTCSIDGKSATLTIAVQDEAGKVDLNIGSEPLLRALVLGVGGKAAEHVVDAILDFRDQDDDRRIAGAERPEYLAAGRLHGPKNSAFLAIEELGGVLGLSQTNLDRLRPFVTIYSGLPAVDVGVAPKALVELLGRCIQQGDCPSVFENEAGSDGASTTGLGSPFPAQFLAASTRRAFSVLSQARVASGTIFVREAVVEFVAPAASAFLVRRWHRGAVLNAASPPASELPPC